MTARESNNITHPQIYVRHKRRQDWNIKPSGSIIAMSGFEESLDKVKRTLASTFSSGDGDDNETDADKENLFSESITSVSSETISFSIFSIGVPYISMLYTCRIGRVQTKL